MTEIAFFGLIVWTLILLIALLMQRTWLVFTGQRVVNTFTPAGADVSVFAVRLSRAHSNCYEFLPFVLALLLYTMVQNQTYMTDPLALVFLGTRIAQSLIHTISTSVMAVWFRFAFFVPQFVIAIYWAYRLSL